MLKSYPLNVMVLWGVAFRRWFRLDDIMRVERPRWDQYHCKSPWGLPQWLSGKESACTARDTGDLGWSLGQKVPLDKGMASCSTILACRTPRTGEPAEPHGQGSLQNPTGRGACRTPRTGEPAEPHGQGSLQNPTDRGAWRATVHGVAQNRTGRKQLSTHACTRHQRACFLALLSTACRFSKKRSWLSATRSKRALTKHWIRWLLDLGCLLPELWEIICCS